MKARKFIPLLDERKTVRRVMKPKRLASLIAILITLLLMVSPIDSTPLANAHALSIEFYREKITVLLSDDQVTVEGVYYFRNTSFKSQKEIMYYPFPMDKHHPYPHEIKVEDLDFTKGKQGVYWLIEFPLHSTRSVKVRYKQRCDINSATYILTSTKHWKQPLEKAEFMIVVPERWENVTLSYCPDRWETKKGLKYYYISKVDFLPQQDLIIKWDI